MEDSSGNGRVEAATGTSTEPNQSPKAHEAKADKGQKKLQSPEICTWKNTQKKLAEDVFIKLIFSHHLIFSSTHTASASSDILHSQLKTTKGPTKIGRTSLVNSQIAALHSWAKPLLKHLSFPFKLWPTACANGKQKEEREKKAEQDTDASLTSDWIWETPFPSSYLFTCQKRKTLTSSIQIRATIVISRLYVLFHKLIREGKTDAVCSHISFWGRKIKKLLLGVSLPFPHFNSSFPNHLSWEAPQRKKHLSKQNRRMPYHNVGSIM